MSVRCYTVSWVVVCFCFSANRFFFFFKSFCKNTFGYPPVDFYVALSRFMTVYRLVYISASTNVHIGVAVRVHVINTYYLLWTDHLNDTQLLVLNRYM